MKVSFVKIRPISLAEWWLVLIPPKSSDTAAAGRTPSEFRMEQTPLSELALPSEELCVQDMSREENRMLLSRGT
jgi:hypothetical protein